MSMLIATLELSSARQRTRAAGFDLLLDILLDLLDLRDLNGILRLRCP